MAGYTERVGSILLAGHPSSSGYQLIQQNVDGVGFNRTWIEYKNGFGNVSGDFWIGNDALNNMTRNNTCRLKVDLQSKSTLQWFVAYYQYFMVDSAALFYKLHVSNYTGGNATDSLAGGFFYGGSSGYMFSTYDQNHNTFNLNCAAIYGGGWWYSSCGYAIMNAAYQINSGYAFSWHTLPSDPYLKTSKMWLFC